MAVTTRNVLTGLKRVALKPEYLRVQRLAGQLAEWVDARDLLPAPA